MKKCRNCGHYIYIDKFDNCYHLHPNAINCSKRCLIKDCECNKPELSKDLEPIAERLGKHLFDHRRKGKYKQFKPTIYKKMIKNYRAFNIERKEIKEKILSNMQKPFQEQLEKYKLQNKYILIMKENRRGVKKWDTKLLPLSTEQEL